MKLRCIIVDDDENSRSVIEHCVSKTEFLSLEGIYSSAKDALIGFLLDGFPVYGPVENGVTLTSAALDTNHGHSTATADYPNGIYHYHITAYSPYINGGKFFGTSGTVTQ